MSELTTISAMLKATTEGRPWHGSPVTDILKGISADQAAARPIPDAHSIWEILLHMNAWQHFTLRSIQGDNVPMLDGADDWPPAPAQSTEDAWRQTVTAFHKGTNDIRAALEAFPEEKLREAVPGKEYPYKVLLHGIVHHNLYHAGQIGVLKKAGIETLAGAQPRVNRID